MLGALVLHALGLGAQSLLPHLQRRLAVGDRPGSFIERRFDCRALVLERGNFLGEARFVRCERLVARLQTGSHARGAGVGVTDPALALCDGYVALAQRALA